MLKTIYMYTLDINWVEPVVICVIKSENIGIIDKVEVNRPVTSHGEDVMQYFDMLNVLQSFVLE